MHRTDGAASLATSLSEWWKRAINLCGYLICSYHMNALSVLWFGRRHLIRYWFHSSANMKCTSTQSVRISTASTFKCQFLPVLKSKYSLLISNVNINMTILNRSTSIRNSTIVAPSHEHIPPLKQICIWLHMPFASTYRP